MVFFKSTKIDMKDNTKRNIIDIKIGDETKTGRVISIAKYLNKNIEFYDYNGIKLSGTNLVMENNKWIPVYKSNKSLLIANNNNNNYYCIGTTSNIISSGGVLFRDFEQSSDEQLNNNIDTYVQNFINNM